MHPGINSTYDTSYRNYLLQANFKHEDKSGIVALNALQKTDCLCLQYFIHTICVFEKL